MGFRISDCGLGIEKRGARSAKSGADESKQSAIRIPHSAMPLLPTAYRRPSTAYSRRGISLLEVLVSTLCLSVGLMGLIALIPLGHHDIVEATKMDRIATLGRLSFRDLQVRGYLRPDMWCDASGTTPMLWNKPPEAFVIDPLLLSYYKKNTTGTSSSTKPPTDFPYGTQLPKAPSIGRVSIRATYNPASAGPWQPMNLSMADRICRLGDDLSFIKPTDGKLSPAMSYQYDKDPYVAGAKPMARQFDGNYCWLVTMAPARTEMTPDVLQSDTSLPPLVSGFAPTPTPAPVASPWVPNGGWKEANTAMWTTRQFKVSVAICYKRDLNDCVKPGAVPAERMVRAVVMSGLAGGEVRLFGTPEWLEKLKPNNWIMLSAKVTTGTGERTWLDWYRVSAVDDGADLKSSNPSRWVTLHGPDWPNETFLKNNVNATIIDSVVGVYQKTITLDGNSAWQ